MMMATAAAYEFLAFGFFFIDVMIINFRIRFHFPFDFCLARWTFGFIWGSLNVKLQINVSFHSLLSFSFGFLSHFMFIIRVHWIYWHKMGIFYLLVGSFFHSIKWKFQKWSCNLLILQIKDWSIGKFKCKAYICLWQFLNSHCNKFGNWWIYFCGIICFVRTKKSVLAAAAVANRPFHCKLFLTEKNNNKNNSNEKEEKNSSNMTKTKISLSFAI